jgi:hypothetical protein
MSCAIAIGYRHSHAIEASIAHPSQKKLMINAANDDGMTPLHIAAQNGYAPLCELLLSHEADIDSRAISKLTPLHLGASRNHLETVKVLLHYAKSQEKSIVNAAADDGLTALYLAAENSNPWI